MTAVAERLGDTGGAGPTRQRGRGARFGELFALATLGVGQPLFDLIGRDPTFLVAHRAGGLEMLLLALLPTAGIAASLWAVEEIVGRVRRGAVGIVHSVFVALLGSTLGLLAAHRLPGLVPWAALALAGVIGVAVAMLARTRAGGLFLATAGALAALLPLAFLFLGPVRRLLLPGSEGADAGRLAARKPVPVVVLVFDELPLSSLLDSRGRVAARRFPNFAELAARSTWYRRATAVSAATQRAVPALLTGRYPPADSLPTFADHPRNLFTMLAGSHEVHAFESLTALCPPSICGTADAAGSAGGLRSLLADVTVVYLHLVAPPAWEAELPGVSATWSGFARRQAAMPGEPGGRVSGGAGVDRGMDPDGRRRDVPRQIAAFFAALRAGERGERPGLYYLHLELPHIPWRFLPDGREYGPISASFFADGVESDTTWRADDWLLAQGAQRHLLQLAYADRVLGELLAGVDAGGLGERALLVVTADHGIAFVAGQPGRSVTAANYGEVLSVPLFVRFPGQRAPAVSDLPASSVDLLPTVAATLDVQPLPWRLDGRSLLDAEGLAGRAELTVVDNPPRRLPLAAVPAAERRAVERLVGWFGDDRPAADLLELGTRAGIAGRPLASFRQTTAPRVGVALEQPWFLDRVEPASGFVPARVVGRLLPIAGGTLPGSTDAAVATDLAIAVNGVVRATTRTFRERQAVRFAALVPPESFIRGRNVVEVFTIGAGEPPTLVPTLDRSGPRYRPRRGADGTVAGIDATNGTSCTLEAGAVEGGLVPEDWYVAGWARPTDGDWPFAVIMVFVGDELAHVVTTGGDPPAGSRGAGAGGRGTGFRFGIPESLRGTAGSAQPLLRVFAVAGERCSELRFERGTPPGG